MLELGLAEGGCQVFQGKAFPGASSALAERLGACDTFVLYPGETAVPVESLAEGEARRVGTLVLLDGTWEQARKMWRASPALHLLPRLRLSVEGPSEYVVRSQPAAGCLSTLEAAAHALAALEGRPELPELLLRPLRAMCNVQIHHGAGRSDPALFRQVQVVPYMLS
jgi:DTW domain-containing protein YfiP